MLDTIMEIMYKKDGLNERIDVQYAVVEAVVEGKAMLKFSGEPAVSQKTYKALKSYVPAEGDRVMLIAGVIIGGWNT